MRLGPAWAHSPTRSCSIRAPTPPRPRQTSIGLHPIRDSSTSSAKGATATEEEADEHGRDHNRRTSGPLGPKGQEITTSYFTEVPKVTDIVGIAEAEAARAQAAE